MSEKKRPLVSCIMPTRDRPAFVSNAIQYFLRQDYPSKELVIVDDGSQPISDLIPPSGQIRYIRDTKTRSLGEKRNFCIRESQGDFIMHWDDDDWMAPHRISYQVEEMLTHRAEICGLTSMLFCELETKQCWLYKYPRNARPWLAGGSLLYTRYFWEKAPFPDVQVASDTAFILARSLDAYAALSDYTFYVASIHPENTSVKNTRQKIWYPIQTTKVEQIIGADWHDYLNPEVKRLFLPADPPRWIDQVSHLRGTPQESDGLPKVKKRKIRPKLASNRKKKVAILITTCRRPLFLDQLLADIRKEKEKFELRYFVVDDAILGNGKKGYWKTINRLWSQVQGLDFDYFLQLPDDIKIGEGFISRAIAAWEDLADPKKICLNLLLDDLRIGRTNWTDFWPQLQHYNETRYLKTQWVDMMYICEKTFFERLQWKIQPISLRRWQNRPHLSSGVGQQISHRFHKEGWHLYQITEKLLDHLGEESVMNPSIRIKEPIQAVALPYIFVGIASIPEREALLQQTISSIVGAVDRIYLFLNQYTRIPSWLDAYPKVIAFLSSEEKTDRGDAGKFYGLDQIKEDNYYYFTIDDDLIYPPDYCWKMIRKIEAHDRQCIVGCGGYRMKAQVRDFYADRSANWHLSSPNKKDQAVHILHTALTAWHSSTLKFAYADCPIANMGDIWLALAAQQQKVPMLVIERPANWVEILPLPMAKTIYGRYRNDCTEQTRVYNTWKNWKVLLPEVRSMNKRTLVISESTQVK